MEEIKLAVMQPYFLPYIGYFQLMAAVDLFIVYDNIKYTKRGWINRNRMLKDGKEMMFSLPLKRDSDSLDIYQREIAADFDRDKLLNQFKGAYQRAPYYVQIYPLIEQIVRHGDINLFRFLHHSIVKICEYLDIATEIRISSDISIDHGIKGQDKVLALCKSVDSLTYINAIGGRELYSKEAFRENGVNLKFIQPKAFKYKQFGKGFVPWLSIIDVMMFNSKEEVLVSIAGNFELI